MKTKRGKRKKRKKVFSAVRQKKTNRDESINLLTQYNDFVRKGKPTSF